MIQSYHLIQVGAGGLKYKMLAMALYSFKKAHLLLPPVKFLSLQDTFFRSSPTVWFTSVLPGPMLLDEPPNALDLQDKFHEKVNNALPQFSHTTRV